MQVYKKVSILLVFCFSLITLIACDQKTKSKNVFINHGIDNSTPVKQINLSKLIDNCESLNGQTIETTGTTFFEFENQAICVGNGRDSKCFWLELDKNLSITDSEMQQLSGQKLTIKGTVDCSSKGHLDAYFATLRDVYYLKTN